MLNKFGSYPLMISLFSPLIKYSWSGVMMHKEFFWPVLGSASMTSVHRFMFTVPWGSVLGWRRHDMAPYSWMSSLFKLNKDTRCKWKLVCRHQIIEKVQFKWLQCGYNCGLSHWCVSLEFGWMSSWLNTDIIAITFQIVLKLIRRGGKKKPQWHFLLKNADLTQVIVSFKR